MFLFVLLLWAQRCSSSFLTRPSAAADDKAESKDVVDHKNQCRKAYHDMPESTRAMQKEFTTGKNGIRCPSVTHVNVDIIQGKPTLKYDTITAASIPKVGSTTIRDTIIPAMAPGYVQKYNEKSGEEKRKGEENGFLPCSEMDADEGSKDFKFIFVRDPLSRFLSGLHEVVTKHKSLWQDWRDDNSKTALCDDCDVQDFVAPYLEDMVDGWSNAHTHIQTGFLYSPNASWPDYVGRIENAEEEWTHIRAAIGLPDSVPPKSFTNAHQSSKGDEQQPTLSLDETQEFNSDDDPAAWEFILSRGSSFSQKDWDIFCEFYRPDYMCLKYKAPQECLDLWQAL